MKILAIGDLVGNCAIRELKLKLPKIVKDENVDFIICNGENVAEGMGITEKNFNDILQQNIDVITMGNHTWGKKDIFKFIDHPKLIRPANYPEDVVGKGYNIFECKGKKIAVINLIGRVDINVLSENPFLVVKKILEEIKCKTDIIIIDFKTNKKIDRKSYYNKSTKRYECLKYPLNTIQDCNLMHYTLQLSMYAYLLQQINPDLNIKMLKLIHIDHSNKVEEIEVEYMKKEVEVLLKHYKKQLLIKEELSKDTPIVY